MLYKRWKGRLLLFLAVFFAAVLFFSQAAAAGRIEDKVLRLHVIANSDSEEDQALKLKVRDQILATLKPLLENAEDRSSSEAIVRAHLSEVEAAARETAWQEKPGENVHAELTNTRFPEKTYGDCTFPAGNYDALRITIGEAKGKNWWCVVFPPLCTTAACDFQETAVSGGLGEEDLSLITEEDGGYVLRFRAVELWEGLRQWLGKH